MLRLSFIWITGRNFGDKEEILHSLNADVSKFLFPISYFNFNDKLYFLLKFRIFFSINFSNDFFQIFYSEASD